MRQALQSDRARSNRGRRARRLGVGLRAWPCRRDTLGRETLNKAARFGASVVLARTLTLEEFGLVNVGIALSGILAIVASLGLSDYGARVAAADPTRLARVLPAILAARLAALVLLGATATGVAVLVSPTSVDLTVLATAMSLGVVVSLDWLLRGQSRMRGVALATSTGGLLLLVLCLTVVPAFPSVEFALGAFIVTELVAAGITWVAADVRPAGFAAAEPVGRLIAQAWPLAVAAIVIYAYSANLDTVLLSALRSPEEAGLYSAPYRVFLAAASLGTFTAYAYLPRLAVAVGRSSEGQVMRSFQSAMTVICGDGVVLLGLTEIAGGDALAVLFGSDFRTGRDDIRAPHDCLTVVSGRLPGRLHPDSS